MQEDAPHLSNTSENISVSLPSWLIEIMDHICEYHDLSRSNLVKRALKKEILFRAENPTIWKVVYKEMKDKSS